MPKARTDARKGKGRADAAQDTAADSFRLSAEISLASASRLAVWKWWLDVYNAMLRFFGYSAWVVEAKGDCELVAFAAGHEIADEKVVANPSAKQTKSFVTDGMRKPAVALLTTGEADGYEASLTEVQLAIVASLHNVRTLSPRASLTALKAKLKPWLEPRHYCPVVLSRSSSLAPRLKTLRHLAAGTRDETQMRVAEWRYCNSESARQASTLSRHAYIL